MLLGRVVKSNSHVDYVVQLLAPGEVVEPPRPEDYAFGNFVRIAVEGGQDELIGVIYDTLLLNPAYGTLGPHLSSDPHLTAFAPDYLPETATVVGIAVVGWRHNAQTPTGVEPPLGRHGDGESAVYHQGVPPVACRVGAEAVRLEDEQFRLFHGTGETPRVAYLPRLAAMGNPAMPELINGLLTRLIGMFPDGAATLKLLRSNLDWSARVSRR